MKNFYILKGNAIIVSGLSMLSKSSSISKIWIFYISFSRNFSYILLTKSYWGRFLYFYKRFLIKFNKLLIFKFDANTFLKLFIWWKSLLISKNSEYFEKFNQLNKRMFDIIKFIIIKFIIDFKLLFRINVKIVKAVTIVKNLKILKIK